MTAPSLRPRRYGPGLMELALLALAVGLALWTALSIQGNAQAGVQRWQTDVANADLQLDRKALPPLTQAWCQRDGEAIRLMLPQAHTASCATRIAGLARWRPAAPAPLRTDARDAAVLDAWLKDLRARSDQIRDLMGRSDERRLTAELLAAATAPDSRDSAGLQEEVSLEQQAAEDALRRRAEALQRQERWDRWVTASLEPLLKLPATEVDPLALWSAGLSLDGYQGDAGGQMVRRHLSASANAAKAAQSLQLHDRLPLLLVLHAVMTWLMVSVVRRPWPVLVQSLALTCLGLAFWTGLYLLGGSDNPIRHPRMLALLGAAMATLWLWNHFGPKDQAPAVQPASMSLWVLPGWWLFTAMGWLLLWDQSLNFHPRLRFLALEQWESWCIAAWLLPVAACHGDQLLRPIGRFNAWWLSMLSSWQVAARVALAGLVIAGFAVLHRLGFGQYITGEFAKALVLVAAAGWSVWKLPVIAQLWQGRQARTVIPIVLPAAAILLMAAAVAVVTADKGPFLVLCMVLVVLLSSGVGWAAGIGMVALGFMLMVLVGVDLDVVGARLQAWRDPFTADLDDMARLKWFQAAASESPWGFGPGRTPWCGTAQWDICHGLPLQLQSDYTFTAIKGWWGPAGGWVFLLMFSVWCFHLMARTARDSVRWTTPSALLHPAHAGLALRTHLLFITALLVLLQTWVTAAGNLGWLPLTGVTWPLVSFGKTSLWVTTLFLGAWGLRRQHA
jgi:cell division protein FtsW (lipid II flippase)